MFDWKTPAVTSIIALVSAGVGGLVGNAWKRRSTSDRELFVLLRQAFDRPAFRGPFLFQTDRQAFREAIAMTLKAVETGKYFDRAGKELGEIQGRYRGPFSIRKASRRKALERARDHLQKIEHLLTTAANEDTKTKELLDKERDAAVSALNVVWREMRIPEMRIPTEFELYEQTRDPNA